MTPRVSLIAVVLAVAAVAGGCGGSATTKPAATKARAPATGAPATGSRARAGGSRPVATAAAQDAALRKLARRGLPVFCGGRKRPLVALTFDDGPGPYTPLALRILRKAHVHATFFLVGRNLARFPGLAEAEARAHAVGDHTWTHAYLPNLSAAGVAAELGSTRAAVRRAVHRRVALFRPPYGARDVAVDAAVRRLGMVDVLWSVDSRDYAGDNWAAIARNVKAGIRPGAIVLMHENRGQTIRALKFVILPYLRRRHVELVTVPTLLAEDPPSPAQLRNGPRGCGTRLSRGTG
jgi:peptidoglycan/xylan/chitin deacetylase (PgdA/CDA1 family)